MSKVTGDGVEGITDPGQQGIIPLRPTLLQDSLSKLDQRCVRVLPFGVNLPKCTKHRLEVGREEAGQFRHPPPHDFARRRTCNFSLGKCLGFESDIRWL